MHPITQSIALGRFPDAQEQPCLEREGITHVLNVCGFASRLVPGERIREIAWHPILDCAVIPDVAALEVLDTLHRMVCEPDSRVFVHCQAGQQRAPTIVWLYLIACGLNPDEAARRIQARAPGAMPGHPMIADARLVGTVAAYGKAAFLPHPRSDALEPG